MRRYTALKERKVTRDEPYEENAEGHIEDAVKSSEDVSSEVVEQSGEVDEEVYIV